MENKNKNHEDTVKGDKTGTPKSEKDFIQLEVFKKLSLASRNVRVILLALITTCILIFAGFWNSIEFGWLESRITMHQLQLKWIEHFENNTAPKHLDKKGIITFERCKEYYISENYNKQILTSQLENLNKAKIDHVIFIKVPFFGVCFDVNDLGLIGGFSLIILYFVLLYSYVYKRNHLETAFEMIENIKDEDTKVNAYRLISMDQVLTIPRPSFKYGRILRKVPRMLYYIPIMIFSIVVVNDALTFKSGAILLNSLGKTILLYVMSAVFWILLLAETLVCIYVIKQTDDLWHKRFPI